MTVEFQWQRGNLCYSLAIKAPDGLFPDAEEDGDEDGGENDADDDTE